jgi:hypothetical protein
MIFLNLHIHVFICGERRTQELLPFYYVHSEKIHRNDNSNYNRLS